jgi:hypothetical protein
VFVLFCFIYDTFVSMFCDIFLLKILIDFICRSFYTGIGIHTLLDDGTLSPEKEVHGYPEGARINLITW